MSVTVPTYQDSGNDLRAQVHSWATPNIDPYASTIKLTEKAGNFLFAKLGKDMKDQGYTEGLKSQQESADGNLVKADDWSIYGESFNEGARAAFSAQKQTELETAVIQAKQKFQYDPEGFQQEMGKFRSKWMGGIDANLQPAFGLHLDRLVNTNLASITADKMQWDRAQNGAALTTRLENLETQLGEGIIKGRAVMTPEGHPDYQLETGRTVDEVRAEYQAAIEKGVTAREISPQEAEKRIRMLDQSMSMAKSTRDFIGLPGIQAKEKYLADVALYKKLDGLEEQNRRALVSHLNGMLTYDRARAEAGYKTAMDEVRNATEFAALGIGVDRDHSRSIGAIAAYSPEMGREVAKNLGRAKEIGFAVKGLTEDKIPDARSNVLGLKADYEKSVADYEAGKITADQLDFKRTLYSSAVTAFGQRAKSIADDPWNAVPTARLPQVNPMDREQVNQARALVGAYAGVPVSAVPVWSGQHAANWRAQFDAMPDPILKAASLTDLRERMGNDFDRLLPQLKLGAGYQSVAYSADPNKAGVILNSIEKGKELSKSLDSDTRKDIEDQFSKSFGRAFAFNPAEELDYREAFSALTASYVRQGGMNAKTAAAEAAKDLTTGRKFVKVGDDQLLVPSTADENAIKGIKDTVKAQLPALGVRLPNGMDLNSINVDQMHVRYTGGQYVLVNHRNVPLALESDGRTVPLTFDGSGKITSRDMPKGMDVATVTPTAKPNNAWNTPSISGEVENNASGGINPNTAAKTLAERLKAKEAEGPIPLDPFASKLTVNPGKQYELAAVSAAVKDGSLPWWLPQYLDQFGVTSLKGGYDTKGEATKLIKSEWAKPEVRQRHTVMGDPMSPLESLATLINEANRAVNDQNNGKGRAADLLKDYRK